jgi:O-antigen ligase
VGLLLLFSPWWVQKARETDVVRAVAGAWLAAALVSSAIGMLQYFGVDRGYALLSSAELGQAYGNLQQRNQYATLLNVGLVSLIWWAEDSARTGPLRRTPWIWHGAALMLAVGNAASLSRTGMVQLLVVVVITSVWKAHAHTRAILVTATGAYVTAILVLPLLAGLGMEGNSIFGRIQNSGDACTSRLTLWSNILHLISQRPWLGWGWGELDYAHFITLYDETRFCEILDNAHNLPLHLAVELGVPAAFAVCATLVGLLWRAQPWRERNGARRMAWGVVALILLHSMFEYPLWYGPFQLASVLCALILLGPSAGKPTESFGTGTRRTAQAGLCVCGVCILGAVVYAAVDYRRINQIYLEPARRDAAYRENTLEKISDTWLFKEQIRFAEYMVTPLGPENAEHLHVLGLALLHYSPEASVVAKLIDSARALGKEREACAYEVRFKAAYRRSYEMWKKEQGDANSPEQCFSSPNRAQ